MKIGLIDVDGHNFPNLALMKISSYHKSNGDLVEWYDVFSEDYDIVYMSKVFTFTLDYQYPIHAKKIIKGGTGYSLTTKLDEVIERQYPDYELYYDLIPETKTTAYGFLTRGCPRGCNFCIVKDKEGLKSCKVADLSEFWNGQKKIKLLDPNLFACKDWKGLAQQLIDSKAEIDFTQGCDIRIMTEEKAEYIKKMKIKTIHFAWDRIQDTNIIIPKFEFFKKITQWDKRKLIVYVLTNFDTTHEQDLYRCEKLKELGYSPYIMIYDKEKLPKGHITIQLQRYVNNRFIYYSVDNFEQYKRRFEVK